MNYIPMYMVTGGSGLSLVIAWRLWGLEGPGRMFLIVSLILIVSAVWGCLVIGRLEAYKQRTTGWTNAQLREDWERAARLRDDVKAGRYSSPAIQDEVRHHPSRFWHDTCIEFWRDIHEPLLHDARLFGVVTECSIGICLLERSLRQKGDSGHLLLARIIEGRGLTPLADGEKPNFFY